MNLSFKKAMLEANIPSNEEFEEQLIAVFVQYHKNDIPGKEKPECHKFPPNNEDLLIVPPTHKEWRQKQSQCDFLNTNLNPVAQCYGIQPNHLPPGLLNIGFPATTTLPTATKLIGLIFKCFGNDNEDDEVSVIISGNLSTESTMDDVMKEYTVGSDLNFHNLSNCKFLIKKTCGSYYRLKYD